MYYGSEVVQYVKKFNSNWCMATSRGFKWNSRPGIKTLTWFSFQGGRNRLNTIRDSGIGTYSAYNGI